MMDYVTRIRTKYGDKQIDYNSLANLPTLNDLGVYSKAEVDALIAQLYAFIEEHYVHGGGDSSGTGGGGNTGDDNNGGNGDNSGTDNGDSGDNSVITFYCEGEGFSYQGGLTWADFVNSDWSSDRFTIDHDYVYLDQIYLVYADGSYVNPNDIIVNGEEYWWEG